MLLYDPRGHRAIFSQLSDIAKEQTLFSGDCSWLGGDLSWGIELKTPSNVMSSAVTVDEGTGFSQLYVQFQKLSQHYDVPILLVYGVYSATQDGFVRTPSRQSGWRYSSIECLFLDAWMKGIYPAKVPSEMAAAQLIRAFYEYSQREGGRKMELQKARYFSYTAQGSQAMRLVCALPGVNVNLAERLLKAYSTPLEVFTAEVAGLDAVRGIASKKAQEIFRALRTPWQPPIGEPDEP